MQLSFCDFDLRLCFAFVLMESFVAIVFCRWVCDRALRFRDKAVLAGIGCNTWFNCLLEKWGSSTAPVSQAWVQRGGDSKDQFLVLLAHMMGHIASTFQEGREHPLNVTSGKLSGRSSVKFLSKSNALRSKATIFFRIGAESSEEHP